MTKKTPNKPRRDVAQAKRFIAAAREAGCSEDEAEIRENMRRIASAKPKVAERRE
jgi:DNA-binding IclR family transcriptional regulator